MPIPGAWGDLMETLLQNSQQTQINKLNMDNIVQNMSLKQQEMDRRNREDEATRAVFSSYLQNGQVGAQDKTSTVSEDDSPIAIAQKQYKKAQEDSNFWTKAAFDLGQHGGNPAMIEKFATNARMAQSQALDYQKELRLEQGAQAKRIGSIAEVSASEPNSPEAFQSALANLPPDVVKTNPWDRDMKTGNPVLGPVSQRTMKTLAFGGMDAATQILRNKQIQDQIDAEKERVDRREERKLRNREIDQRAAEAKDGRQQVHEDTVKGRVLNEAQRIGNEYKTDEQVKEFATHKTQLSTAYNYIFDKEGKIKPEGPPGTPEWANHDSASDFELARQFIAVVHPKYRGTMSDLKELKSLPNLPEHLANMIAGVAAGKVLAQSDRVNMFNAMKRVVSSENDAQIEREDKAMKRISNLTTGYKDVKIDLNPEEYVNMYALRPTKEGAAATPAAARAAAPSGELTATNPKTGQKVVSKDGGKTWQPVSQ